MKHLGMPTGFKKQYIILKIDLEIWGQQVLTCQSLCQNMRHMFQELEGIIIWRCLLGMLVAPETPDPEFGSF